MGTSREQLGNTGSVETSLSKTEGSTETGTTGTNNDGIVLVVLLRVRNLSSVVFSQLSAAVSAYNDRVLLGNVAFSGLGAQRLVGGPEAGYQGISL